MEFHLDGKKFMLGPWWSRFFADVFSTANGQAVGRLKLAIQDHVAFK